MTANEILRQHFKRKKRKGYSLRALARDLEVSPTFISRMFNSKKKVPLAMVGPIARVLDMDFETVLEVRRQLLPVDPLAQAQFRTPGSSGPWAVTTKRSLSALRQWFYLPLMELTCCIDYDGSHDYLARRLGLSPVTVEVAVRELISLSLLEQDANGYVRKTDPLLRMASSQSVAQVRAFHRQMLKRADEELSRIDSEAFAQRLIMGVTVTAAPEDIAIAKKMLADSLHEIANFLAKAQGTEVYHLAAQLFPLTKK